MIKKLEEMGNLIVRQLLLFISFIMKCRGRSFSGDPSSRGLFFQTSSTRRSHLLCGKNHQPGEPGTSCRREPPPRLVESRRWVPGTCGSCGQGVRDGTCQTDLRAGTWQEQRPLCPKSVRALVRFSPLSLRTCPCQVSNELGKNKLRSFSGLR